MVGNGENLILGAGYEVTLVIPVAISDSLSMLGNARNLSLTFSIKEKQITFLCTDYENWMGLGPTNEAGNILVGSQLHILELLLTHRPNRNHARRSQDCQGVIILVPNKVVDSRRLIAWKLKNWFALTIHNPDDFVVSAHGNKVGIRSPC